MQAPEQPHGVSDPILDWMESERFTETVTKAGITATLGVAVLGLNAQVLNPWIGILLTLCALALLGVLRLDPPLMRVQRAYRPIRQLAWVTLPPGGLGLAFLLSAGLEGLGVWLVILLGAIRLVGMEEGSRWMERRSRRGWERLHGSPSTPGEAPGSGPGAG